MNKNQENKQKIIKLLENWYQAGKYQEIIDACEKFLTSEPNFTEAGQFLEKAKAKVKSSLSPTMEDTLKEKEDKLREFEHTAVEIEQEEIKKGNYLEKIGLYVIVTVLIFVGGFFFYKNQKITAPLKQPQKASAPAAQKNQLKNYTEPQKKIIQNNLIRHQDLKDFKLGLQMYFAKYKSYPEVKEIGPKLINEKILLKVPLDPRHKEKNAKNQIYGYIYRLIENKKGYIISVIYEGLNGEDKISVVSNLNIKPPQDPRDLNVPNTAFIEDSKTINENSPPPAQKVKRKTAE